MDDNGGTMSELEYVTVGISYFGLSDFGLFQLLSLTEYY